LVEKAIQHKKKRSTLEATWKKIIQSDPRMNAPHIREYFEAMFDLAPDIMKHKPMALPVLKQSVNYDLDGVPPQLVATLARAGNDIVKSKPSAVSPAQVVETFQRAAAG